MKFLHTSDIHYGATPDAGTPWAAEREKVLKDAFSRILRACRREQADLLLIAGDLFDALPTEDAVREVNAGFASIPQTRVVILPGDSDGLFVSSPVLTFPWNENVTYVAGDSNKAPAFYDEKTGIYMTREDPELIEHKEQYTYIALGGKHKPQLFRDGQMVYSGSPEPLGPADTGRHGYYVGEIDEDRSLTSVRFVSLPTTRYISLVVNVTPASTNEEVLHNIKEEISRRGDKNIYRLRLQGMCDPSVEWDFSSLPGSCRIAQIVDQTEPKYDFRQLFADHPSDMVGFFIREMNREDISPMDKKALYFGVRALLKTAEERC